MKRNGMTLVEVLVAIFVMALGMMALLTLFPLGALRMAQAIQDNQTGTCAHNADAIATMKDIRHDPMVVTPNPGDPSFKLFEADLGGGPPNPNGPSNPVLVDPAGFLMSAAGWDPGRQVFWVDGKVGLLPRCTTSFTPPNAPVEIRRWFSFLDEYEFERVGPTPPLGEISFPPTRDYAYSWTYLLQRPKTNDASVVNCSVMVFRRRPMALQQGLNLREFVYFSDAATTQRFDTQRNVVTIDHGAGEPPPIKAGDWIMDASVAFSGNMRYQHANFYRAVTVTEVSASLTEVEVQTPLRGFEGPRFAGNAIAGEPGVYRGTVVVFDGLVEVFERGTGWK